ncbi:MAG: hypothetical protein M3Y68_09490 [Chloroflexota bacterium]|nr:hypothetical protein [Chloroflexota bacterium]
MDPVNYRRIFVIAGACSLFLSYVGIWLRMINDPVERTGADFIHFYSAGRIAQIHGSERVYNPVLQHDVEEEVVGFELAANQFLPYNHMPFLIPLLQLTMSGNYVGSFYRWVVLMIVVHALGLIVFGQLFKIIGVDRQSIHTLILGGVLFLPFFVSLMNGQDTSILFLGTALWVYGLVSGKPLFAGIGLSLTLIRPHISLVLALPMFFHNRRIFLGYVMGSGILGVISFLILGMSGTQEFIDMLLLSAGGEWYGIKPEAMFNLIGLLTRALPWLAIEQIRLIGWTVYGLTIIGLSILWWQQNWKTYPIGLTVVLALFVAPHLYFHDLTILLIPIAELILFSHENGNLKTSVVTVLPIATSMLFLVSNISPLLQYTVPYLLMAVLIIYAYRRAYGMLSTTPHRS